LNINQSGKVTIVGTLLVDGRTLVCSGGACDASLDNSVDETRGDLGVEGKVVAGVFESYCPENYVWVPGSAKYGTMPGFCVMSYEARKGEQESGIRNLESGAPNSQFPIPNSTSSPWTNISQGSAIQACQSLGTDYHLLSENEWLTIAENIIKVKANKVVTDQPQALINIATSSYALSTGQYLYGLIGAGEWTNENINKEDLIKPVMSEWMDYRQIKSYGSFTNIRPPYFLDSQNGIGLIKTGENYNIVRGFIRGTNGIYSLDLSNPPNMASDTVGFRCAR
jgi:hypothetical protein